MSYLKILKEWESDPMKYSGLCGAVGTDKLELFEPTYYDARMYPGRPSAWGASISEPAFGLNDFRRNVMLFLAAMNGEL